MMDGVFIWRVAKDTKVRGGVLVNVMHDGARPGGQLARDIDGQRLPFGKVDRFSEDAGTAGHSAGPVFD